MNKQTIMCFKHIGLLLMAIVCLLICNISCQNKHSKKQIVLPNAWFGNWINNAVFDTLNHYDTLENQGVIKLNFKNLAVTEIVLNKVFGDSILLINEDVETKWIEIKSFTRDTIFLSNGLILAHDSAFTNVTIIAAKEAQNIHLKKVPKNLLKMPTNIGNRIVPTAFRKLFNAAFYKYSFVLIDSNFSVADRHFVSFFADGKIKGFNAFTHFYLYLNGKQNNIENAMALEVTNSKTKTILGLKNYPDSIELFTIAKNLNASKKPYFICNKKTATLIKQKWY